MSEPVRIFCFVNSGKGTDWQHVLAMDENGVCLAEHVSSSECWAKIDIGFVGVNGTQHYGDVYEKAHPGGYILEWVDSPREHVGLMAAYEKNQARGTIPPVNR